MLTTLLLILAATPAFAKNAYQMDMKLKIAGQPEENPRIIVVEGEPGSITTHDENEQDDTFIEVTAKPGQIKNKKGILLNLVVATFDAEGKKQILGTPQILTKDNGTATISVADKEGKESFTLEVKTRLL